MELGGSERASERAGERASERASGGSEGRKESRRVRGEERRGARTLRSAGARRAAASPFRPPRRAAPRRAVPCRAPLSAAPRGPPSLTVTSSAPRRGSAPTSARAMAGACACSLFSTSRGGPPAAAAMAAAPLPGSWKAGVCAGKLSVASSSSTRSDCSCRGATAGPPPAPPAPPAPAASPAATRKGPTRRPLPLTLPASKSRPARGATAAATRPPRKAGSCEIGASKRSARSSPMPEDPPTGPPPPPPAAASVRRREMSASAAACARARGRGRARARRGARGAGVAMWREEAGR